MCKLALAPMSAEAPRVKLAKLGLLEYGLCHFMAGESMSGLLQLLPLLLLLRLPRVSLAIPGSGRLVSWLLWKPL